MSKPNCECLNKANKGLADKNTILEVAMFSNFSDKEAENHEIYTVPKMAVRKRDSKNKQKPTQIIPSYCPFCGVKYGKAGVESILTGEVGGK